jgi:hypothetical protein
MSFEVDPSLISPWANTATEQLPPFPISYSSFSLCGRYRLCLKKLAERWGMKPSTSTAKRCVLQPFKLHCHLHLTLSTTWVEYSRRAIVKVRTLLFSINSSLIILDPDTISYSNELKDFLAKLAALNQSNCHIHCTYMYEYYRCTSTVYCRGGKLNCVWFLIFSHNICRMEAIKPTCTYHPPTTPYLHYEL